MSLAEFLLARIAEDKGLAERCRRLSADVGHLSSWVEIGSDEVDAVNALAGHFCPTRVLAECEVKRRIVTEHRPYTVEWLDGPPENACWSCGTRTEYPVMYPCPTLRLLALAYADHLDYLPQWRP
jgi:hypothetical protein